MIELHKALAYFGGPAEGVVIILDEHCTDLMIFKDEEGESFARLTTLSPFATLAVFKALKTLLGELKTTPQIKELILKELGKR